MSGSRRGHRGLSDVPGRRGASATADHRDRLVVPAVGDRGRVADQRGADGQHGRADDRCLPRRVRGHRRRGQRGAASSASASSASSSTSCSPPAWPSWRSSTTAARNGARITTWVLGGISLCCSGFGLAGTALTSSMNLDSAGTGGGPSTGRGASAGSTRRCRPGTTPVSTTLVGDLAAGHPGRDHPAGVARVERVLPQAGRPRWDPSMPYPYPPSGQPPYPQTGQPTGRSAAVPARPAARTRAAAAVPGQPPYRVRSRTPPVAAAVSAVRSPPPPPSGSPAAAHRSHAAHRSRGRPPGDDDRRPPSGPTTAQTRPIGRERPRRRTVPVGSCQRITRGVVDVVRSPDAGRARRAAPAGRRCELAAALLVLMALVGLGYAIATLAVAPGVVDRFRGRGRRRDSTDVDGYVTVVWIGAALGAVLAVILFALYVGPGAGPAPRQQRRPDRHLGGLRAGPAVRLRHGGHGRGAAGRRRHPGTLGFALSEAYPGFWIGLNVGAGHRADGRVPGRRGAADRGPGAFFGRPGTAARARAVHPHGSGAYVTLPTYGSAERRIHRSPTHKPQELLSRRRHRPGRVPDDDYWARPSS